MERDKGASIRDKKIPFDYLCDEYLKFAESNLGPTFRERRIAIKAHLKPFFVCYAGDITELDLEAYKRGRTKVSPATINNELKVLSCIFKFGIEFGYLADMPKIKRLKVPVKNPHFLSEDQVGAVLSAAEPRVRPMIQFLIFTGMRKGEMAHLEWTDIKLEETANPHSTQEGLEPEIREAANHRNQRTRDGGATGSPPEKRETGSPFPAGIPGEKRLPGGHSGRVEPCMRPGRN